MELENGAEAPEQEAPEGEEVIEESQPATLESVASTMGWSPQEEWRGDPEKWKPADQFLTDTATINKSLSSTVKKLESNMDVLTRTSARMTEMQVEKVREEVLAERNQAFEEGDSEAFNKAEEKLKTLDTAKPDPSAQMPPETQKFLETHDSWLGKNDEATALAQSVTAEYAQRGLSVAKQLEMAEREVKKVFPELFPDKPKAPPLNSPGARSAAPKKKGFTLETLPPEARKMADDYAKKGLSTVDFLKAYNEEAGQ